MEQSLNILIVDDELTSRVLLKGILSQVEQFNTLFAEDGEHGLQMVRQQNIDILITDFIMPGMNGIELATAAMAHTPGLRSILVTGKEDKQTIVDALRAGMSDYIAKPVTGDEVLHCLHRIATEIKYTREFSENQERVALYFKAMQQCSVSILITDKTGNIEYVNPYFTNITGYSCEDIIGKNPRILRSLNEIPLGYSPWDRAREVGEWRGEFENIKKSGEVHYESAVISTVKNDNGELTNFIVIKEDITEKKMLLKKLEDAKLHLEDLVEQRTHELEITNTQLKNEIQEREKVELLRQQEQINAMNQNKFASLGEIATGVAHEINQPLTYINTVLQTSLEKFEAGQGDPVKLIKKFGNAIRQTARITAIIQHLRVFGRADDGVMIPIDLPEVLENCLVLLNERIRLHNVILEKKIDNNLPSINGNSNKLEQLLINFFQNSLDALEEKKGGTITVSMAYQQEREKVVLSFSDDGSGIPAEVQEKIFQPFFTTKEVGKGTGVGLSIIYGIVQDHKGTIAVCSEVGKGTTFTVTFPAQVY